MADVTVVDSPGAGDGADPERDFEALAAGVQESRSAVRTIATIAVAYGLSKEVEEAAREAKEAFDSNVLPYTQTGAQYAVSLVGNDGAVVTGRTLQNAAFPSTLTATASAFAAANAVGVRAISDLVVYGDIKGITPPLLEFLGENQQSCRVHIFHPSGGYNKYEVRSLPDLPQGRFISFRPAHYDTVAETFGPDALQTLRASGPVDYSGLIGSDLQAIYQELPSNVRETVTFEQFEQASIGACIASANGYAPYSNFVVGSSLILADGTIVSGCNFEVASLAPGLCAERTAMARAHVEGHFIFDDTYREQILAVVNYVPIAIPAEPCCGCRQALLECGSEFPTVAIGTGANFTLANNFTQGEIVKGTTSAGTVNITERISAGGFVPAPFSRRNLMS